MIAPHPHERPLRAGVILVSALFWAGLALLSWTLWERYAATLTPTDVALVVGVAAIVAYAAAWVTKAQRAVSLKGHAVEIGPDQHPDLHARMRACAKRLGFAETPVAFLFQQPYHVLSFSLRYAGRDHLALNGELVGALTEHQGAIDFFIGYELGRLHDPDRGWRWLLLPGRVVPLLGPAYARAKIYSYDRHGIGACRNRVDAALAVALMASGSRRWKSSSLAHYAQQSVHQDSVFDFFEVISGAPYLSRRSAHLRGVATGDGSHAKRHPLAWVLGAVVPGVLPRDTAAIARAAFATLWIVVAFATFWHSYQGLAAAGLVQPLESRFENKVVPITGSPLPAMTMPPPAKAVETNLYSRVDEDLKLLGELALTRHRKLGGVPCDFGKIESPSLNFRPNRYAFSCDEPIVYTVIEAGEFEPGRTAHLRSYNWRDNRVATSLPPTTTPTLIEDKTQSN
ncbi:MAG TPA: hypothetical protein VJS66_04325 [Burkholderiales bacterium]|nr:hypothetical protein [Burkholderiales bacterium]